LQGGPAIATRLERSFLRPGVLQVQSRVEVRFEAVELTAQYVFGEPGDYVDALVHFAFRYPDGRVDTNCTATIWHALRPREVVQVTVPAAYRCPAYASSLERAVEEYYRSRVGPDGTVIRIGPKGASLLVIGVPLESAASAVFEIDETHSAA
jgi:hypothetical protein